MATTFDNFVPLRRWRPQAAGVATQAMVSDRAFRMLVVVMCMFGFRDMLTSSLRYYLSLVHLGALWFVPDVFAFVCFGYFAWNIGWRNRSPFAILLVCSFIFSMVVGMIFMQSNGFAIFSAAKLFMPFFVGASLVGRSVCDLKWARMILTGMFVTSTIGLLLEPHVVYPWLGQALDNFGQTKNVGRVWWSGDGNIRYGGFAGESTMASYMAIVPYFIVHRQFSKLTNILLWIPIYYAVLLSTNKTALGVLTLFMIYYAIGALSGEPRRQTLQTIAKWSFATVPLTVLMMLILGGVDLTSISRSLFSLQDRISNTWGFPFIWMSQNFPAGLLIGCGMGCFTYPMEYTPMSYLWVPVDNFYMATIAMMGIPFIVFIFGMFGAAGKSRHLDKLLLMTVVNLYSVTVQGYGPSTCAVFLAYAFSDMFLPRAVEWSRRGWRGRGTPRPVETAG